MRHCTLLLLLTIGATPMSLAQAERASPDDAASKPPYFNHQLKQLLIEGSYSIIPTPPIMVSFSRQLLLDDSIVSDSWGCKRTVHQPEKYSENPILASPTTRRSLVGSGTVLFDDEEGKAFSGDSTDTVLSWKEPTVDSLSGRVIRLHFWMDRAALYSFWFE